MRVLILEDDPFHEEAVEKGLKSHFKGIHAQPFATEKEFVNNFELIAGESWTVAIFDQMLPWTSEDDDDVFTGAPSEGPLRAGTRCYERLQRDARTKDIPVIFFTNLDRSAIPPGVEHVRKKSDPKLKELISKIEAISALQRQPGP